MTELGPLPQEWEVVRLIDYVNLERGTEPGSNSYNKDCKGLRFIRVVDISGSREDIIYTTSDNIKYCSKNDILITFDGSPGLVRKGYEGAYSSGIRKLVFRNNTLDRNFTYFVLQTNLVKIKIEEFSTGVTIKHASKSIPHIKIPLPPLPEQCKIATILSTVQKAIEIEKALIERTKELKKSMMHKLFTEGIGWLSGVETSQKQTEIGPIPENWEVGTIGKNAQIKGGKRIPKGHKLVDEPTGYPYIRVSDFKNYSIDCSNLKFLLPETQKLIQRYTISDSDVFISIAGTIGICGMIPSNLSGANLTENAAKLTITNKNIKPRFLMYFLSTDNAQKEIHLQTVKNAQPKLALARIASLKFPIPSVEEQQAIADILSTIDQKIEHHTTKKQKLEELFRSLLHELMTARVRVNEVELKEVIK